MGDDSSVAIPLGSATCAAGLLAASILVPGCGPPPARPNVLLITADTLRADHLGCYGYEQATSPNLDRLAARGVVFESAYAQIPKTNPSLVSLMTGLYPGSHKNLRLQLVLPDAYVTLAEVLRDEGYQTAGIVGQYNLHRRAGVAQGFEYYSDTFPSVRSTNVEDGRFDAYSEKRAGPLVDEALSWLSERDERPFFLWIHFMDPHAAYDPPPPHDATFEEASYPSVKLELPQIHKQAYRPPRRELPFYLGNYDGEIGYLDRQIGRLLDGVGARGLDDETMILFTADHGEYQGDTDGPEAQFFSHGGTLTDGEIRVPLIWKLPPAEGREETARRVRGPVELVDVVPTLAELLSLPGPDCDGVSRAPELLGQVEGSRGRAYSYSFESNSVSLSEGDWKLIYYPAASLADYFSGKIALEQIKAAGHAELYDRRRGGAGRDESGSRPTLEVSMTEALLELVGSADLRRDEQRFPVGPGVDDPELVERLKALGYL